MNKIVIVLAFFLFAAAYQAVRTDGTTLTGGGSDDDPMGVDTSYIATQYDINRHGKSDLLNIYASLGSSIVAETDARYEATVSNYSLADQFMYVYPIWLPKTQTLTGVKWIQVIQGNYTADNNNKIGLYSYSGGTLTLVASSTDDGNLWKGGAATMGSKAFSSTYAAEAGLYYVAVLYSSASQTTAPALGRKAISSYYSDSDFTNSAKLSAYVTSQTDLPASIAMSSMSSFTVAFYFALY